VFNDPNADGIQESGEAAMAGVPVYLDMNDNQTLDPGGTSTYRSDDTFPMPIPDYSVSSPRPPAVSTVSVSGVSGIRHLTVSLDVSHTWDSDLTATLTNPSGTTITLFSRVGSYGHDFTNTTFDDSALGGIGGGSAPFSGSYQPQQPLSTFSTQDANGTWTLKVSDGSPGDSGSVLGWSISINSYAEPTCFTDDSGHYRFSDLPPGSYQVREAAPSIYDVVSPASASHSLTLSASDSTTADFGNRIKPSRIEGTVYLDANRNGAQDLGEPGQGGVTVFLDTNGNGVPDSGETSTVTDSLGRYTFSNVAPDQAYSVREVAPSGSSPTSPNNTVIRTGTNVNLSRQPGGQTESAIAIDPTNPDHIFALSNTTNGTGLFAAYSLDGGATWSAPHNIASGTDGLTPGSCDGSVSYDSYGNLFLTYIDASIQNVVVAVSTDNGQSFTQLTKFTSPVDQPTITTGPGSVWVLYSHYGVPTVSHATVSGKGPEFVSPFSAPMGLSEPANMSGNFGDIAVGPDGQVAVAYQNAYSGQGPDKIYVNASSDGSNFGPYLVAATTDVGSFDLLPAQPIRSVDAEAGLAYDRSDGPHRGRLYLVYTDAPAPGSSDTNIFLRYSDNNGSSWSPPVQVNDDDTTNSQFLPKLAVDASTGNVAVSFYDARESASNTSVRYSVAISTDGGQTFLLNKSLSAGVSTAPSDSFNFGDYSGLAYSAGKVWAAWGDNSNSTGDNGGELDLMVNSASLESLNGYEVRVSAGQTVSGLNFGNDRAVTPQLTVDDFLYPFALNGPDWIKTPVLGAYRGSEHIHHQDQPQSPWNTAQWAVPRPAGTYEVFADWTPSPDNATDATYSIYDGSTLLNTVHVDQTVSPSDASYGGVLWKSLGTYSTSSSHLTVVLGSEANGNVVADAVMVCAPVSPAKTSLSVSAPLMKTSSVVSPTVSPVVPDVLSVKSVSGPSWGRGI
jgi:subtilisin-like proprotein convertase family protein